MPSFDIVSEIEMNEVRNAVDNANRELSTRFDFRGVEASIEFKDESVVLTAEGDFQIQQLTDMLRNACSKRNLDTNAMDPQDTVRSGKTHRSTIKFKQGIEQPIAKKIVKLIKDKKMKVQASIQGDQLRVTGKKRDDLQAVMALLRGEDMGQPLQFNNFRD
ncbi:MULTISPECIES: YajQ family cyclic di-GMP-binding protein [Alteromonadaceae]|uniref:YajQ family cyclic di-GMP-binding protein n=1 Tax=Alteromonadaceae TaxID=72275 RepID=UPI001C081DF7|nr:MULTISPECIES: YajQ family cyclic di-GMP-binding protein [Aliiglaciecola]MBU2876501.1 YajQ family cyclic di-GMP-binding protein [Aliiglaciecola lipolytica]MDO6713037.1 YajQ family cyclic di-GMP-binding protein [Aliiglaciecola sp. 2_MG-2023]MDO6754076.1 YajQ family cyclic di-GMP-binding protein [Aliiglaciecola sp. 1_MG-2023]